MNKKLILNKLKKIPKVYYVIVLFIIVTMISITIPSLARYKNRVTITDTKVWDGSIATSYQNGTGSKNDPYIISNGSELAYFSKMLETTNYSNTYFKLNNDIILNNGIFNYTNNKITYTKEGVTISLEENNNQINLLSPLTNFKGTFDGDAYTIYGLCITSNDKNELGLFTNLSGTVTDLSVENAVIYGGNITGGIAANATTSTIKNTSFEGFIVGNNNTTEINKIIDIEEKQVNISENNNTTEIQIPEVYEDIKGPVTKTTISGTCQSDMTEGSLSINGHQIECNNNFEVPLDSFITNKLTIDLQESNATNYHLSNLKYTVYYNSGIASGIIADATNVTLENVINKAQIFANGTSAGLIALSNKNLAIKQSYSTGNITSNLLASGLVGIISGESSITKSYSTSNLTGNIKSGIIGTINEISSPITITDTFQTTADYSIDTAINNNTTITNSYQTMGTSIRQGTLTSQFQLIGLNEIKQNISYPLYQNIENQKSNPNNVWILDKSSLPILFIDNILESDVLINVGDKSWNSFSNDVEKYYYSKNITFNIEPKDNTSRVEKSYYHISNSTLTKEELATITDWTLFENIAKIEEEGTYIIYVKTVDYNGNIDYLNTDILMLDLTNPKVQLKGKDKNWDSLKTNLANIYISNKTSFTIDAIDELSKVEKISYYISDHILSNEDLEMLEENFQDYQESIIIENKGTSIIYVKVEDKAGNKTYVNSDYIIYGGYEQIKMYAKDQEIATNNVGLTINSKVAFEYKYEDDNPYQEKDTHNLIVNTKLPKNTKITLIDKIKNKVYTYIIASEEDQFGYEESCSKEENCQKKSTIPFTLFKEVGTKDNTKRYIEKNETKINEHYKVILDFENINKTIPYENIYTEIHILDENKSIVRSTLKDNLKSFSLYPEIKSQLYINSTYSSSIIYNSDSLSEIPLNCKIISPTYNEKQIIDTTIQNKTMGLMIRLLDSNNKPVDKKYLKSLEFKVGDTSYFAENDGLIRINLKNNSSDFNTTLKIITNKDYQNLKDDNYHFEITSYLANDGLYSSIKSEKAVNIPVIYEKNYKLSNYNFDLIYNNDDKILDKQKEETAINFSIITRGDFLSPNIRVTLYQKEKLTAYNQKYSVIDLNKYLKNNLVSANNTSYYLTTSPISYQDTEDTYNKFTLNLLTSKLTPGGYSLKYELYDGDKLVGEISNKFIVK